MRRQAVVLVGLLLAACGGGSNPAPGTPSPQARPAQTVSAAVLDSLWSRAEGAVRQGEWREAAEVLERLLLELPPGDARIPRAHFLLGEAHFARGSHLEAAREFRKASDDTPNAPIAPEALLRVGDVYADLWRRPELDPSYGQTALATYQELLNRYPGTRAAERAQLRITELNEKFAHKAYKAGLYYFRLKAYDSAILYLRDLVANYPRTEVAPEALVKLVEAYQRLGYKEDVQETCDYIRRFHPTASGVGEVCPGRSERAS